jgi:dihydrolipoamide dehydrogenase
MISYLPKNYNFEILKSIHTHPTMSEAVMEAVADAYGEVIHL